MRFLPTRLPGVLRVESEPVADMRGYFARTYCQHEFQRQGLRVPMVQDSTSFNARAGTLRGLHYHAAPFAQTRLVRCAAGSARVVVLDLRRGSATFLGHLGVDMRVRDHAALYIPPGLALGFQTLEDETEIHYQMSEFYDPQYERGVRWNDPAFGIEWPAAERIILERDANYPDFALATLDAIAADGS